MQRSSTCRESSQDPEFGSGVTLQCCVSVTPVFSPLPLKLHITDHSQSTPLRDWGHSDVRSMNWMVYTSSSSLLRLISQESLLAQFTSQGVLHVPRLSRSFVASSPSPPPRGNKLHLQGGHSREIEGHGLGDMLQFLKWMRRNGWGDHFSAQVLDWALLTVMSGWGQRSSLTTLWFKEKTWNFFWFSHSGSWMT